MHMTALWCAILAASRICMTSQYNSPGRCLIKLRSPHMGTHSRLVLLYCSHSALIYYRRLNAIACHGIQATGM